MSDFDRQFERMDRQMTVAAATFGCMTFVWFVAKVVLVISIAIAMTKWAGVW